MAPPRARDPDTEAHFDLAAAYLDMGLVEDAISELTIVLRLDPRHPEALDLLAKARDCREEPRGP